MNADDGGYANFIDVVNNSDLAYAFKKKRLRYLRSASVSKEILWLRDNFNNNWGKQGDLYYFKDPALSNKDREIILGLFGDSDKATTILKINMALIALDRER